MALSSEVTFPHKKSAHRKVRIKRQLTAEGWPQSLEKAGLQLSPIWPPTEALLPAIALYCAPSKEECEDNKSYYSLFKPIPAYSSLFQHISAYFSLFHHIKAYFSIVHSSLAYSSLLKLILAEYSIFLPFKAYLSLFWPIPPYSHIFLTITASSS